MIYINKKREPEGLVSLRELAKKRNLSPVSSYRMLGNPLKSQVRNSLLEEQGHLCAYCMCTIPRDDVDPSVHSVIIEHVLPRKPLDGRDLGQGLDYGNMIAVCNGNKGAQGTRGKNDFTCDAHKGNQEFRKLHPCEQETLKSIYYEMDGRIFAKDKEVNYDLVQVLNLNSAKAPLLSERKAALDSLILALDEMFQEGNPLAVCQGILQEYERETDPKTPYSGILLWYLEDMIHSLEK